MDLSSLPPEPAELKTALEGVSVSSGDAIETAESETDGAAAAVEMDFATKSWVVTTYSDARRHMVTVDAMSGGVTSSETAQRFPGWDLPADAEMQETGSGLMYFVIEEGEGTSPSGPNATVEVHYSGYLVDGTKFDSSIDRGQTIEFPLNRVISGWTEGVAMMSEGGKRKLVIPSELGYGARGAGGTIPPNAMLVFDVELVSVVRDPDSESSPDSGGDSGGGE